MDMLPPQAPPADTQTIYHEAERSFDRVVATQAWLATEHASLPALPDDVAGSSLPSFLGALDAWWNAPPSDGAGSRRVALGRRLALAANDLAILDHQDGTMDDAARALVRAVTSTTGVVPDDIAVSEVLFDGTPYAGVLLTQRPLDGERALLFSTDRGWEVFEDGDTARLAIESRARLALVSSPDLPGIARQHLQHLAPDSFVTFRTVAADPFATLADGIVATVNDKVRQAWFEFGLAAGSATRTSQLGDTVAEALRVEHVFDAAGALAARQARLTDAVNDERLARVPADVAAEWRTARDAYLSLRTFVDDLRADKALAPVKGLQAYALDALRVRLKAMGVTQDPSDIDIDIVHDHAWMPGAVLDTLNGGKPPQLGLVDLAYRNIGSNDPVRLTARDRQGHAIPALGDATLRQLVRDLDLHHRYPAYLDGALRTAPEAPDRRSLVVGEQRGRLRFLANEARLSYYLPEAPRSFRKDHAYRGFKWVSAVLDRPTAADRAKVEGHAIVVSQLTYQGVALRDVFMIGVRDPRSVPAVVLYTPDAPDGVSYREFDSRADAGRRFLYEPAFREYLLDRLPIEFARIRPNGTREFAGDRLANWVLGGSSSGNYTFTAEPFGERVVEGDLYHALYETDVQLGQRNARWLTTSTADAQTRWREDYERRVAAGVFRLVKDVVTAPVHAASAGWRLYDSVKAGDTRQAFVDFTDFYVASLWAAPGATQFAKVAAGRGFVAGRFRAGASLVDARAPMPQKVVFESRYRATGVRKAGEASDEGVFTVSGKNYIEHDGALFGARFDADYGTWRLARPGAPTGAWGPAIVRNPMGGWTFRKVGLPGGSGRGAAGDARALDLFDEFVDEAERAFPDPVERELVTTRMRAELAGERPAQITATQRANWVAASERAQARAAAYDPWLGGLPRSIAQDLTTRPLPPGIRRVPTAEVPPILYFYDRLPYRTSRLTRDMGRQNEGFSNNWGELQTELLADGFPAVRVTTMPPTAARDELAMAINWPTSVVPRNNTFAVTFGTEGMLQVGPHESRAAVDVFAPVNGPAGTYYLVPNEGRNAVRISYFTVTNPLPRR